MLEQARIYDDGRNLPSNAFTAEDDSFASWNTKKDGTGTSFANGSAANITAENGVTVTLYAQWTCVTYTLNGGNATITGCTGNKTALTIPNTISNYTVTAIAATAFQNKTTLTSITIPSSITSIGAGAFFGCSGLTGITLPFVGMNPAATGAAVNFGYIFGSGSYPGGTATSQYYGVYYVPSSLKTVVITGVTSIGQYRAVCVRFLQ
jgi:hypothetical protein